MKECFECGYPANHNHHVVPKSKGGKKTVPLCDLCHSKVHNAKLLWHSQICAAAMDRIRRRGKKTGGTVPFGYDVDQEGNLVENAEEMKAVKLIRKLRADGVTLMGIAAELERRGIKTKTGKAKWTHAAVNSILKRKIK